MKKLPVKNHGAGSLALLLAFGIGGPLALAATVSFDPAEIVFEPDLVGQGFTLRVSCSDGTYVEDHYLAGETATFFAVRPDGSDISDGPCKYELRIHPEVDKAAVESAYTVGDEALLRQLRQAAWQQTRVQTGSFEIAGGLIVELSDDNDQGEIDQGSNFR